MTISRQEVKQMASFMRALNPEPIEPRTRPANRPVAQPDAPTDVQAMRVILERFHGAAAADTAQRDRFYESVDDAAVQVQRESRSDRELREALVTERTASGSRIGDWEIKIREDGKRKFYSVAQRDSDVSIATDLLLYEAAHALVRILNEGGRINSKDAIKLLRAEQDYAEAVNNAVLYKHYMMKKPNDKRIGIFEARYSEAQQRALIARDIIDAIYEN